MVCTCIWVVITIDRAPTLIERERHTLLCIIISIVATKKSESFFSNLDSVLSEVCLLLMVITELMLLMVINGYNSIIINGY